MNWRIGAAITLVLVSSIALAQEEKPDAEGQQASTDNAETRLLKEGDKAPDFDLESLDGKMVKLSDRFQGVDAKPVVLLFSRAHW